MQTSHMTEFGSSDRDAEWELWQIGPTSVNNCLPISSDSGTIWGVLREFEILESGLQGTKRKY